MKRGHRLHEAGKRKSETFSMPAIGMTVGEVVPDIAWGT